MVIHLDLAVPQKLSKTEILAAGSLAYKVGVEAVETRGSMWFYCKGAPKNSINRGNLANATLGEDYSASFDMEIGNPSNMKHDCPWPTSSNPRHMPADLKVARWPCSGSLNVRKANIYYLSEIDSSYSGAGYNWIQISALPQISTYNLGMSCYLPHDWNHTVDNVSLRDPGSQYCLPCQIHHIHLCLADV